MKKLLVSSLSIAIAVTATMTATADPGTTVPAPGLPTKRVTLSFEGGSAEARIVSASSARANVVDALVPGVRGSIQAAVAKFGASIVGGQANAGGATTITLSRELSAIEVADLSARLAAIPGVAAAEPELRLRAPEVTAQAAQPAVPSDPGFPDQWGLAGPFGIGADRVWGQTKGVGVRIAVIDSGITAHPDLDANIAPGYDFISDAATARDGNGRDDDPSDRGDWIPAGRCGEPVEVRSSWHGTHVAGIVAAVGDNGTGIIGVAPGAKVVPVRALGACGGDTSDIADAIVWASGGAVPGVATNPNPAKILNLSLSGPGACPRILQSAIDSAAARGAIVVAAAGNEAMDADKFVPGNCRGVVGVAATGDNGKLARYSNVGSVVDVSGPGGDFKTGKGIVSTYNSGGRSPLRPAYGWMQGTSQATPMVSGALALLWSARPDLKADQLIRALTDTARPVIDCAGCGSGLIDVAAALVSVKALPKATPKPTKPPTPPRPIDIYATPGEHFVNGRRWLTTCEPYSRTSRCRTEIWASQVTQVGRKFVTKTGWVFNNLTYLASPRSMWAGNPLAKNGGWVSAGRRWKTECDTARTGRNGCRSWAEADVVHTSRDARGKLQYTVKRIWVLNNMVRFN